MDIEFLTQESQLSIPALSPGQSTAMTVDIDGGDVGDPCAIALKPYFEGSAVLISTPQIESLGVARVVITNHSEDEIGPATVLARVLCAKFQ